MAAPIDASGSLYARHPIGPNEIRLIHLQQSTHLEDRVVANMSVVPLEKPGKFHSISYSWGSAVYDDYIICDDLHLPVTINLHAGLKRIREKMAVRQEDRIPPKRFLPTIWADAVCKDQSNDKEKSGQVEIMASIYLKAASLIIWLGEADHQEGVDVCASLKGLRPQVEAASTVQALIKRPWFTRRWIIQEVFSNRIRHVLLGGSRFVFEELQANADKMGRLAPGSFARTFFTPGGSNHATDLINYWPKPKLYMPALMDNLIAFRSAACASDLDRVYSLLSISREEHRFQHRIDWLDVDYSVSPYQLYRSVSQYYFEEGWAKTFGSIWRTNASVRNMFRKSLIMATTTAYGKNPCLPSWVPDWAIEARYRSESHQVIAAMCFQGDEVDKVWNEFHDTADPSVVIHDDELQLKGWLFPTCSHGDICCSCAEAGTLMEGEGWPYTSFADLNDYIQTWPFISPEEGEVIFYMKGWSFAFILAPTSNEGQYRLSSSFLIQEVTKRVPDETREWVVGFGRGLRDEVVRTVRII